jgi:predicted SPOUT superfamily RNA methylase MTH1
MAIPASIVADVPHLREKTSKIGLIGRAAAIFRVESIAVYPDETGTDQRMEIRLIADILRYHATPPYLRKLAIKIQPSLQFAGILPPLLTPNHPPTRQAQTTARSGDLRDGWVLGMQRNGSLVEVGLKRPVVVKEQLRKNSAVTVRIDAIDGEIRGSVVDSTKISIYWGYRVHEPNLSLGRLIESESDGMIISTSRFGRAIQETLPAMREQWQKSQHVTIIFGSPKRGLYDIARSERFDLDAKSHFVVNAFPEQGVQTIRTEEAVLGTLTMLNASI